jgi:hypothetical protein
MTAHLIHIGFAKTGTTLVTRWFEAHPQIAFVRRGIAGFASANDLARAAALPDPAIRCRATLNEVLTTPNDQAGVPMHRRRPRHDHGDHDSRARARDLVASLFPNAHILLVTRGFRSMLLSGFSQYVRIGGTRAFFTLRPLEPDEEAHDPDQFWNYDRIIELYEEAFGDRLIVLPYELLRDDPEAFTAEIERRLGLDHCPVPAVRTNPSFTPEQLRWYPRLNRLVLGLPIGDRARDLLRRFYLPRLRGKVLPLLVRGLQAIRPDTPVTGGLIPQETIDMFRGRTERLRGNRFYDAYRDDYVL